MALPISRNRFLVLLAEFALVGIAFLLYTVVHALVGGRIAEAESNAEWIVSLEKKVGLFWEHDLQDFFLSSDLLVNFANLVYVYAHLPLIAVIAAWLYWQERPFYLVLRNAFFLSGAIGLVIYATLPVAPPRLMTGLGFTDTVYQGFGAARPFTPSLLMNEYAAMPSLHFGWSILLGLAVWHGLTSSPLRALGLFGPPSMFIAVVATGNHFVLDNLAGAAVVVLGVVLALAIRNKAERAHVASARRFGHTIAWLLAAQDGGEARAAGEPEPRLLAVLR